MIVTCNLGNKNMCYCGPYDSLIIMLVTCMVKQKQICKRIKIWD